MRTPVGACFALATQVCAAQAPLHIPELLTGNEFNLLLQEGTNDFFPGQTVATYGYNGAQLGPTLELQRGSVVTLNVTNLLPDLTTTHWHGLHVPPEDDGGPHSLILPNTTWSPSFTVLDRASTFWYHPHGHGLTDYQVSMGAAGMIIVRDDAEAALALPRDYGVDDIPLILQAKAIMEGQIMLHTGLDSVILANGVRNAFKELPAQVVRLRCLNGASERTFNLGLSNNMPYHVIGTDGGLLSAPVQLTRMTLMPGERAELLLDLSGMQGEQVVLRSYASELPNGIIGSAAVGNGMATLDGYDQNALNGADFDLITFTVGAPTSEPIMSIPQTLVPTEPYAEAAATVTRTLELRPQNMGPMEMIEGPFLINDALMDMDVINLTVPLGSTEIWRIENNTPVAHPIHIHDIQFNVLDRNGLAPEPWETGWKDVVHVPPMGVVRVITRFDDFADAEMPYMYHCHLLMHEDEGMMGQFLVVDPNSVNETEPSEPSIALWPNPTQNGLVTLRAPNYVAGAYITVTDALGRALSPSIRQIAKDTWQIALEGIVPGAYVVSFIDPSGRAAVRTASLITQ